MTREEKSNEKKAISVPVGETKVANILARGEKTIVDVAWKRSMPLERRVGMHALSAAGL